MSAPLRCASFQVRALSLRLNHVSIRHQATSALVSAASSSSGVSPFQPSRFHPSSLAQPCAVYHGLSVMPHLPLFSASKPQSPSFQYQQTRTFAIKGLTRKKKKVKISAKKLHEQKMKIKAAKAKENAADTKARDQEEVAVKHREWVDFQKSISVEGFETGQLTDVVAGYTAGRQARAQRKVQKLMEKRVLARKEQMTAVKQGHFPALRMSDEETARWLAEATANIPKRMGRRGTRNLKRQGRRWFLVRKIHKKYKRQVRMAKHRKEAARLERWKRIKTMLKIAPEVREVDRSYQLESFRRWSALMGKTNTQNDDEWEDIEDDETATDGKAKTKM